MRSASLIVLSRWATRTTVLPARAVRRFSWIARSVAVSRWLVASSKIRISGLRQQRPGDRQPLPLAAGEVGPALADDRLVPLGQARDELVQPGGAGRLDAPPPTSPPAGPGRCSPATVPLKMNGSCDDQADPCPQRRQVEVPQVHAVDQDAAPRWGGRSPSAASAGSTCPSRSRRRSPRSCRPGCAGSPPPARWRGSRSGSRRPASSMASRTRSNRAFWPSPSGSTSRSMTW